MDFNSALVFVKVIQAGSFSEAGRRLNMPVSTVSTKITQLEARLGVTLIQRTTRRLQLSEAGARYFEFAVRAMSELHEAEASATEEAEPRGIVRVTGPIEMGISTLSDTVAEFQNQYPEIQVELILTERYVDLVAESVDIGIRIGQLKDSSLVARSLGATEFHLFATPHYLKKNGIPKKPSDLLNHRCILFRSSFESAKWDLQCADKRVTIPVKGAVSTNNLVSVYRMTLASRGIAMLPSFFCRADLKRKALVQVMPQWHGDKWPVHLLQPPQKFTAKRTRLLADYLVQNLKEVF